MSRTGAPRRRTGLAAVAAVAGLVVSGCAQNAPLLPEAELHDAIDCRSEPTSLIPNVGEPRVDPSIPVPGRVPAGFEATTAAVRCSLTFSKLGPVGGAGADIFWRVERFEGDLGPLLTALAASDDVPPDGLVCSLDMEVVPALWLETRAGGLAPVRYPRDGCGKTKPAVRNALDGLQVTMVERIEWDSFDE
ncbi:MULTISPECIES: hypothetical protein [unclassified Diaminobutyricimonas]|uniref:hypothetical protein n=1 Tax=unclassified Diaminobutyricimonas TaxID=2643261 RepID=UPI0012F4CF9E|nr:MULTISPECIES: hypothetical protein [unclassified Diaminobutyricimonas]